MHFSYFSKKTAAILDFGQNGTFERCFRDGHIKIPKLDKISPLKSWVRKKKPMVHRGPHVPTRLNVPYQ